MDPIAFQIGPITIAWYGIILVLGLLAGAYLASVEARRRRLNPDHIWNALLLVAFLGLVGARLYHVISSPQGTNIGFDYYRQNPTEIFNIAGGIRGLGVFGAVVGGLVGAALYARVNKLNLLVWLDVAAPGVLLGQAIGRWGNFFNQELYGNPTTLPWGIAIDLPFRLPQFADLPAETRFHPTFLYESLWNFASLGILLYLARRHGDRLRDGDLLLGWALLYPIGRLLTEIQRPDAWLVGEIPMAQIISAALILLSASLLIYRHGIQPRRQLAV